MQFTGIPYPNQGPENTFQFILYETINDIQVNYLNITSRGNGSSVAGIENRQGDAGLQYKQIDVPGNYKNLYVRYSANSSSLNTQKLYYPHVGNVSGWETEICLINNDESQVLTGGFKAYDDKGNLVSDVIPVSLPPFGRKEMIVSNEFINSNKIGYIVFESDSVEEKYSGYLKFYQEGKYRVAVPAIIDSEINETDMHISHIASDANWWTGISLLNTSSSAKELTFEFDNGIIKKKTIDANEHQVFYISDFLKSHENTQVQSAVIRGGKDIIGLELFGSTESSGNNYRGGVLLKDDTANILYYPHVVNDENWWTGIAIYNPSESMNALTITPFKSDGTELFSESLSVPLDAQKKYAATLKALEFPGETAWIKIEAATPVTGFELFATNNGNQMAGFSVTDIIGKKGTFSKLEKSGWTGIAFVNIESTPANIILTAYDNEGNLIAAEKIVLKANEKRVKMAEEFFTKENIDAAAYIRFSSDKQTAAFQLNGSSDGMMLDGLPGR